MDTTATGSGTDAPGRVIAGRYRLESAIGRGGTATVFRAHDESLDRSVALKIFHAEAVDLARQESELAVLAALDHHSLVGLIDAGVDDGDPGFPRRFLVMAFITGTNLHRRVQQGPLAPRHIAEIGYDVAEALEYIHAREVIHRDVKPSNILLVDYGDDAPRARAKLTDFGIALAPEIERITTEGVTTGTAAYLSPEQAAGAQVGPASDIYSLGLALLECFTRTVEFPGTVVESALARLSRDPVVPAELAPHWRDVLTAMTARQAEDRPTGRELVSALRQVVIAESARHKDPNSSGEFALDPESGPISDVLERVPDEALQRITALAARLFHASVSVVSVVDQDRTWLKSYYGPDIADIARHVDLAGATTPAREPIVIEDCSLDPRTRDSVLVTGPLGVRFYAGVPLVHHTGETIGTLSVLDRSPKRPTAAELENLRDLGALVVAQLELRQEGMRTTGEIRP